MGCQYHEITSSSQSNQNITTSDYTHVSCSSPTHTASLEIVLLQNQNHLAQECSIHLTHRLLSALPLPFWLYRSLRMEKNKLLSHRTNLWHRTVLPHCLFSSHQHQKTSRTSIRTAISPRLRSSSCSPNFLKARRINPKLSRAQ